MIYVVHLYACYVPRGTCKQRRMVVPCGHPMDADPRYGDGDLSDLSFEHAPVQTTKGQKYRCLPLSHKVPMNENNYERIYNFPCIPQP